MPKYYCALEFDKKEQIIETLNAAYADVPDGSGTVMAYERGGFHGNGVGHMNGHFGVPPFYEMGRYGGPSGFQGGPHRPGFLPGPPPGNMGPPSQSGRAFAAGGRFAPYQRPHYPSYDRGAGRPSPARMPWMPRPPYMQDGMYKK
ncbi:hypothetical protein HDU88_008295 [Geranomyces variabilis]|nr:hypothetical protein HDU88_008295 [Geranomyces variabilis]